MKKEHLISLIVMIALWQLGAGLVQRSVLLPYPVEVVYSLLALLESKSTYVSVGYTVLRVFKGFVLSLLTALVCSIISDESEIFRRLFAPVSILANTIPNISYMILALIWLGSEGAVSAVSFFILFPIFYNGFANSLSQEDLRLKDVLKIYPDSMLEKLRCRTLPLLGYEILATGRTAASMGLKVGVMAEILGAVRKGIGRELYYAHVNLDTARVLAWTLVIVCISVVFNILFTFLIRLRDKEEKAWRS